MYEKWDESRTHTEIRESNNKTGKKSQKYKFIATISVCDAAKGR